MSDYPLIRARWFTAGGNETPTRIVVHRMEAPEKGTSAEDCARYFATTDRKASAHLCVDSNSIVRSVLDGDIAFHAPPNKGSLGIEHAGTGENWGDDQYDIDMLALSAKAVARWCRQYNIPATWLSPDDLRAGKHGITCHFNVSQAWHLTTHTDGQFFPYAAYLVLVRSNLGSPATPPVSSPTKPEPVRLVYRSEADHMQLLDVDVAIDKDGHGHQLTDIDFAKASSVSGYEDLDADTAGAYGHFAKAFMRQKDGKLDIYVEGGAPGFTVPVRVAVCD